MKEKRTSTRGGGGAVLNDASDRETVSYLSFDVGTHHESFTNNLLSIRVNILKNTLPGEVYQHRGANLLCTIGGTHLTRTSRSRSACIASSCRRMCRLCRLRTRARTLLVGTVAEIGVHDAENGHTHTPLKLLQVSQSLDVCGIVQCHVYIILQRHFGHSFSISGFRTTSAPSEKESTRSPQCLMPLQCPVPGPHRSPGR